MSCTAAHQQGGDQCILTVIFKVSPVVQKKKKKKSKRTKKQTTFAISGAMLPSPKNKHNQAVLVFQK